LGHQGSSQKDVTGYLFFAAIKVQGKEKISQKQNQPDGRQNKN
jgi:hypothetical protein